jgi:iron(III) transport system permease protein
VCVGSLLAGLPLAAIAAESLHGLDGYSLWNERSRLFELAENSVVLMAAVLAISLPVGVATAVLIFRTDLPGRSLWRLLALISLFIPLPLVATAWQMAYGWWSGHQLWLSGLWPAIVVHATLAVPWVIVLSGLGLSWVEPELEEDALSAAPPWQVLLSVTLPRASPAIALAALAVALATLNEIAVTDRFQVRTFAEEVYSQFVGGRNHVAVAIPQTVFIAALTWLAVARWRRAVPRRQNLLHGPRVFFLGRLRLPLAVLVALGAGGIVALPLAGLVWKAGLHYGGVHPVWDAALLCQRLAITMERQWPIIFRSLRVAALTGGLTAIAALLLCWLALGARWFERLLWLIAAVLWALPGPVIGVGLLQTIEWLLDLPGGNWLEPLLYSRPSPWPHVWVCALRFLPLALAALWPLVRLLPEELDETAVVDGLSPWQRFTRITLPLLFAPLLWAALGVAILTLGEVSATKLLETPDFKLLAKHVFELMHSSADTEVAAVCVAWLGVVSAGGLLIWLAQAWMRRLYGRW